MKIKPLRLLVLLPLAWFDLRAVPEFDSWVEEVAQEWMRSDPMSATRSQYLPPSEQAANDRRLAGPDGLTAIDASAQAALVQRAKEGLEALKRWPVAELTPVQRVSYDFLQWRFQNALRQSESWQVAYIFNQFAGFHAGLVNFLTQTHPIRNAEDVENYVVRLQQVAPLIDRAVAEAKARGDRGIIPPRFIVDSTLRGLDRFLAPPPAENVFVTSLRDRTARIGLSPAARAEALTTTERITAEAIIPAFQRIRALLVTQQSLATDAAGISSRPGGVQAYAHALENHTTTKLTADEIHAIGLREVSRLEAEMDVIFRQLGYVDGTIAERMIALNRKLIPPAEPDPRPAIIEQYTRIVREAEQRAPAFFDLLPKAPVEVRREPPFTEAGAAARYTVPAPDGSSPGIFWAPILNLDPDVLWLGAGMKTVAYHEAIPGHHYQLTLQQELPEVPRFRKYRALGGATAFSEGWGLYSERLADEAGWYEGDPEGRLGYLQAQLFRARRLVVDTGLHAKGWSRQQAIDYGIQPSEVERYIVNPGQACAYMIGYLKIVELRERAKAKLGDQFSLKQYHNLILRTGTVPLDVLEQVVDEWIAGQVPTAAAR